MLDLEESSEGDLLLDGEGPFPRLQQVQQNDSHGSDDNLQYSSTDNSHKYSQRSSLILSQEPRGQSDQSKDRRNSRRWSSETADAIEDKTAQLPGKHIEPKVSARTNEVADRRLSQNILQQRVQIPSHTGLDITKHSRARSSEIDPSSMTSSFESSCSPRIEKSNKSKRKNLLRLNKSTSDDTDNKLNNVVKGNELLVKILVIASNY